MLDDSGKGFEKDRGTGNRRKRVQSRTRPPRDLWDPGRNVMSHHSRRRLKRYRFRRTMWLLQIMACLGLGLCIPYSLKWTWDRVFYKNDGLKLTRLIIETSGTLSDPEIAEASGLQIGTSLGRINSEAVGKRISALPAVLGTEVTHQPPDSLMIRVKERVPVAWLSCPDHGIRPLRDNGFLIDRSGVVFSCRKMTDLLSVLPTIEVQGIPLPDEGARVDSFQVAESLRLIAASDRLFTGQGMGIIDVRALSSWGLLCRYSGDLLVTFDLLRIDGGLRDLGEILRESRGVEFSLATVDLVTVKNIPVTFHSAVDPLKWRNRSSIADESSGKGN